MRRRPVWLCSDRFNKADDNGRAFFEYLNTGERKVHGPDSVFAVESTCRDYSELKQVGRVVNASGLKYKLAFLTADYVISAYHTKAQRMPFSERSIAYLKPYCLRPRNHDPCVVELPPDRLRHIIHADAVAQIHESRA